MRLDEVWAAYAADCLGAAAATAKGIPLGPWEVLEQLFDWHPHFSPRMQALDMVRHDAAFDEEADGALCTLAMDGHFKRWDGLTAGAWRVLADRLTYAETVCLIAVKEGLPITSSLPSGLTREQKAIATGLRYLLGGARSIDPRLLAKWRLEPPGLLPASTLLRRQ